MILYLKIIKTKILLGALVLIFGGLFFIGNNLVFLRLVYPEKIWIHRVNSVEKLKEVDSEFRGIELDIVWEKDDFDVNHPLAKSIGLSLEEYLYGFENTPNRFIWLDFKNLNKKNAFVSLDKLNSIVNHFSLSKSTIIIESTNTEYLKYFYNNGYKTSFYLPDKLNSLSQDNLQEVLGSIDNEMGNNFTDFISFPIEDYAIVKKKFPDKDLLLWDLSGSKGFKNKIRLHKALIDLKVKSILLPYKVKNGDR